MIEPAFAMANARVYTGCCREVLPQLPEESVQCCVTSPPYWGLRDYGDPGQLGLEATPEDYIWNLVLVLRQVRRLLRKDGTLWLNLGDSYHNTDKWGGGGNTGKQTVAEDGSVPSWEAARRKKPPIPGLKPKDLVGIPWRAALALQADGWYLRSDIIWHKPNVMPNPVTDRPTMAHEYLFLLSKSKRYYYDGEAIKETEKPGSTERTQYRMGGPKARKQKAEGLRLRPEGYMETDGFRNKRSVWTIPTRPYKKAHFAVFPPDLVLPCILAGTSEKGCCPACGASFRRILEKKRMATRPGRETKLHMADPGSLSVGNRDPGRHITLVRTVGWEASCACGTSLEEAVPAVVLDPFCGSGTVGKVALEQRRQFLGVELNPDYLPLIQDRMACTQMAFF